MAEKQTGRAGGYICYGTVVNRIQDPSQTGRCKVRWEMGGINQSDMSEDDLPWSPQLFHGPNPSKKGVGGPHTGFLEGTRVMGFSPSGDGQDIVILGSLLSAGSGDIDGQANYNSEIPPPAKSQENGGQTQGGTYGDKNVVVTQDSIITYAQNEGGQGKAQYADIPEPIGTFGEIIPA